MKKIKRILPSFAYNTLVRIKVSHDILKYYRYDFNRQVKIYMLSKKNHLGIIEGILAKNSHSIEKGLTKLNFRPGFGKTAIINIINVLEEMEKHNLDFNNEKVKTALSVFEAYVNSHSESNENTKIINQMLSKFEKYRFTEYSGYSIIDKSKLVEHTTFSDILVNRHSIRDFGESPVDSLRILNSIEMASHTPSACNRQSWFTRIIKSKKLIAQVLNIQNGFKGNGENIDTLLLVTSNDSYFYNPIERKQGYIDGGLYSMNLINSLHYFNLATCALNTSFDTKNDKKMRELLNIGVEESFIMFIAVGNYKDKSLIAKSHKDNYLSKIFIYSEDFNNEK